MTQFTCRYGERLFRKQDRNAFQLFNMAAAIEQQLKATADRLLEAVEAAKKNQL